MQQQLKSVEGNPYVNRFGAALAVAPGLAALLGAPAFAGYASKAHVGHARLLGTAGETAFTGANLSVGALIVGALVVIGLGALIAGRRRKARAPRVKER